MADLRLGTTLPSDLKLGNVRVSKVCLGDNVIWQGGSWHTVWEGSYSVLTQTGGTSTITPNDIGCESFDYPTRISGTGSAGLGSTATFNEKELSDVQITLWDVTRAEGSVPFVTYYLRAQKELPNIVTSASTTSTTSRKITTVITKVEQFY